MIDILIYICDIFDQIFGYIILNIKIYRYILLYKNIINS